MPCQALPSSCNRHHLNGMPVKTQRYTIWKNATILSMDSSVGDFWSGDLLICDDKIATVGASLEAPPGARIVDGKGKILIPGIVNCHMHTWQTALRGLAANWTLFEYFKWTHRGLAKVYLPEDIEIATLAGALGQINSGTTTLGDWCHSNPTPAHTDAAVQGLRESGIRAVFLHGSPKPDPRPGEPHFSEVPHPSAEIERLLAGPLGQPDELVTLGMAILGPHYSTLVVSLADFKLAKEHGLIASMHSGGGEPKAPGGWDILAREGLIGPKTNIVHGNDFTDDQLAWFVTVGATFTVAPENEMTQGHGWPITGRVLKAGGTPSFGVDIESLVSSDMFAVARMAIGCQRALDNADFRRQTGGILETSSVTTKQALEWVTMGGARALGLDDKVGSLTPGKQADIVSIDTRAWNLHPVHDPYSTIIMQCNSGNVDSVMVAGKFLKRGGRMTRSDSSRIWNRLAASGARIVAELAIPTSVTSVSKLQ